jgi:hypothetical protein
VVATARRPEVVERLQAEGMQSLLHDLNDSVSVQAAVDAMRHELQGFGIHVALVEPGPRRSHCRQQALNFNKLKKRSRLPVSGACRCGTGRILFHEFKQAG